MGVKWTKEQQQVIDLRDRNILVSAAAGSGKTAVLVERIIHRMTETVNPMDVDRLLIVTFTEAAAAEMKERIREAIEKALEASPGNEHLQRQATLIHSAQITTIHSFCLSVIREHFHVIDIDPGFRIGEEGELKLLKQDILDELLEANYDGGDRSFLEFVEKFGTGRNDKKIEALILQLYEYSRSYPQPEKWLAACVESYAGKTEDEPVYLQKAQEFVRRCLDGALAVQKEAVQICLEPDGPYMYADMLEADGECLSLIRKLESFQEMYEAVKKIAWKRLSTKKDESVSAEKKDKVKKLRDKAKKIVKDLAADYFYEEPKEIQMDMADAFESMQALSNLTQQFADLFSEKKRMKNLIDFNDMEQFALQILTVEEDGILVPSLSAREYQEQFQEVMIDEYQDSNLIQETILTSVSTVSRGKNNIFMVGDVKQSIYRFRLSRPELFMEKYNTYSLGESDRQRIDLHKNFRSREEVLEGVNFIFERIMRKELGKIQYDDKAALYPGADFEVQKDEFGKSVNQTELLLVDTADIAADQSREMEARAVAKRIKTLIEENKIIDKETKKYRKTQYRDIVILTRSIKGWADVFSAVLAEEGIPAHAGSQEGYFETYEVSVLLDYLQLLDNQRQDLPLAAVLKSPIVGMNAQEMAEIKASYPKMKFYEAVSIYGVEKADGISRKINTFLKRIQRFRTKLPYTAIHDLLNEIIEETGYGIYIAAMPGGAQRMANIEMLVEKASAFEGTSYKGLFNFVRYIEQLQKYDVDYGEATLADEQADIVRIMSIHKSKGLEFPIVFAIGMGKKFNMQDVTGSVVIHPEWGVGIDAVDLERRTRIPTFLKKIIQEEIVTENLGEEQRVLYVAMTRAKEKLILTGALSGAADIFGQYETEKNTLCQLPFYQLAQARKYLDWIIPAVASGGEESPINTLIWDCQELAGSIKTEEQAEYLAKDVLEHWNTDRIYDKEFKGVLDEQLGFVYPFETEGKMKLKFTVSELKKRAYLEEEAGEEMFHEPEALPLIPEFMQELKVLTGASRGSAYHKLLELLDFTRKYDEIELQKEIKELLLSRKLSPDMAECIHAEDILEFLNCESGIRMRKAALRKQLFKEQPFVLGVDAKEIYPDIVADETILVQGIIDVYFEEEDGLVVLDYKTDRVHSPAELTEKYHAQLDYYAQALEQLVQKPVKEKLIYSFTLRKEIQI